jgi:hypothetical protein
MKENENPELPSIKVSINGECELSDGRVAEITWTRNHEIYSPETRFNSGWIIVTGEDLRTQGIRRVVYGFGREINETGNPVPAIYKNTLKMSEKEDDRKPVTAQDGQELDQVKAIIKELSAKFPPLPETNTVVSIGKETKAPKKSIFAPLKQIFKGK